LWWLFAFVVAPEEIMPATSQQQMSPIVPIAIMCAVCAAVTNSTSIINLILVTIDWHLAQGLSFANTDGKVRLVKYPVATQNLEQTRH
jgi:hypothetical protein